ncbi:MAG TPA: hypothetical protein VF123_11750 [Candidatus Sulfotelmatobacter sp.]
MPTQFSHVACISLLMSVSVLSLAQQKAEDLHIKKSITVGGNFISSTETSLKGARERTVSQGPNGSSITLHQCDLKRSLSLNEQVQTYLVTNDPQDENAAKAAALATGAAVPEAQGGKILVTTTITDTGERKTMYGYQARHLKAKVTQEPSADACTQVRQSFDVDGWFADIGKEQAACATIAPPVQQGNGCSDKVISRRLGTGKLGYPLQETINVPSPDGGTMSIGIITSELTKQSLPAELFDVPAGYRQVNSLAELNGVSPQAAPSGQMSAGMAPPAPQASPQAGAQANAAAFKSTVMQGMLNPAAAPAANANAMAMMQQQAAAGQRAMAAMGGMGGMPQMMGTNQPTGAPVAAPQPLGPKAPGKIRIGVAPPEAQVGQGNNAGADYSTPIRNAEVALMSGPAIEVAALDAHVPVQLQAEAQQKQCDYILFSSVAVKHSSGGFGKFAKFGGMAASLTPVGAMAGGMRGAAAAQAAAGMAASQAAQHQAMSQLAGFNGQIKSKDDVTVQYQLVIPGQSTPVVQNSLAGKAKSDGEDVLTPLLQQAATTVLTSVGPKQ